MCFFVFELNTRIDVFLLASLGVVICPLNYLPLHFSSSLLHMHPSRRYDEHNSVEIPVLLNMTHFLCEGN